MKIECTPTELKELIKNTSAVPTTDVKIKLDGDDIIKYLKNHD